MTNKRKKSIAPTMLKSPSYKVFTAFNYTLLIVFVLIVLVPFLHLFAVSVSEAAYVHAGRVSIIPHGFNFGGYRLVLAQSLFYRTYFNTIFYTAVGTALSLIATILCAYALSKSWIVGRRVLMMFVIFTMYVFPGLIPNYMLISSLFMDSIFALIVPRMIDSFFMILMMIYFKGISPSLEEAASIDGSSVFRTLVLIILPLSKPVLATIALFYAVFFWNDWFSAMLYLNTNEKWPVMLYLREIVVGMELAIFGGDGIVTRPRDLGLVPTSMRAAAILMVIAPIVTVYPFIQKYFVSGVMLGSVKE